MSLRYRIDYINPLPNLLTNTKIPNTNHPKTSYTDEPLTIEHPLPPLKDEKPDA